MTIEELKAAIERARKHGKDYAGKICSYSETGPVSLAVVDAMYDVIVDQAKRIEALEKKLATFPDGGFKAADF